MTAIKGPTLTDPRGMGGINAQDGFDYQVWDALVRLPAWLRNPTFEGMAIEALEDVEALFFAPHTPRGHLLERFQAKSGVLDRAGLIEVFNSFKTFEAAHPQVARVQTLVTPALPAKLAWLARDPDRVRRARPFYWPFADIRAASDDKLRADLVAEFGQELGSFFADSIEVMCRPVSDRAMAEAAFAASLQSAFPELEVSSRKLNSAFSALSDLASRSRGVMLTRSQLLLKLCDLLGTELVPDRRLRLHVRSDRNGEVPDALEIDASEFSGGSIAFPKPERWHSDLISPLATSANWARKHGQNRILLSGSYRLSTAFALGWAFRSAIGFEIDIPTKSGLWPTDAHPPVSAEARHWNIAQPNGLFDGRLVVGVGVLRNPAPDIRRVLSGTGDTNMLLATLRQALTDAVDTQASVQAIKGVITQAVARLQPAAIDFYYTGPVAFAVALGHRWNAMPPTQLHEFVMPEGCYIPTALIS
jgi:hypothetical protein